jgi:predicted ATPase
MDLVWPGLVVEENNLAAQVSALRKVLGGEVIATIPGRGYRFVAPLATPRAAANDAAVAAEPPASHDDATPPALRTNLPAELPALLGRAEDRDALAALVDGHRLVSVVGAGGIGKSLLAQHLLAARRSAYPQGVCWVELTNVGDAAGLPGAIAAALGVDVGQGEPLAALVGAVAPLAMLLALDNAEHLLDGVAHVCRALHDAAPNLRLVVTTQAPLRLAAERVLRIGPLAVPDDDALPAAQALRFGAVALFVERAQAVDQRFALTDANAGAVIATCRALDGVPLAIELAAARAPMLGVDRLLASMQERFRWLTGGRNRAAPARQRALRSALEWSDALLDDRERRVFRRLGVIAGSASLDCIEQVLVDADAGLDRWDVADALDVLVDRSLVAVVTDGRRGERALPPARDAARVRARASRRRGRARRAAASPRACRRRAPRRRVRRVLQRQRRRRRVAAPRRARLRQRARRAALGACRRRRGDRAAHRCHAAARAAAFAARRAARARRRLRGEHRRCDRRAAPAAGVDRAELRPRRHAEAARARRCRSGARVGASAR